MQREQLAYEEIEKSHYLLRFRFHVILRLAKFGAYSSIVQFVMKTFDTK